MTNRSNPLNTTYQPDSRMAGRRGVWSRTIRSERAIAAAARRIRLRDEPAETGTYEITFLDKNGPGAIDRNADSPADAIAQAEHDYPSSYGHSARLIWKA